ncbi:MAG: GNAT family N-acetyltransferase [Galactobacter sp.]
MSRPNAHLRPAVREDVEAVTELLNAAAHHDDTDEFIDVEDQAEEWRTPGFTLEEDARVAVDQNGALLAYLSIRVADSLVDGEITVNVFGDVHPEARRRGLGTDLTTWAVSRGRELAGERFPGVPAVIHAWGRAEDSDAAQLLRDLGFRPARYFTDMQIELDQWEDPGGPSTGRVMLHEDRDTVLETRNEAFADHWGSSQTSPQRWAHIWGQRTLRLDLSRVMPSRDGTGVDAFVLSEIWVPGEVYVALVGTRRAARGRHLATNLLTDVVRAARAEGATKVDLGVDAESPTGANGVYERVGFRPVRTGVMMVLR